MAAVGLLSQHLASPDDLLFAHNHSTSGQRPDDGKMIPRCHTMAVILGTASRKMPFRGTKPCRRRIRQHNVIERAWSVAGGQRVPNRRAEDAEADKLGTFYLVVCQVQPTRGM